MPNFKEIFSPRNRGLLLDLTIFLFQFLLLSLLTTTALRFVHQAEESAFVKTVISLFLIGLFLLQPLGPILKRWSFHQHFPTFEKDQGLISGLLLSFYKFFYIGAMWIMIYLAFLYAVEAFPNLNSGRAETLIVALAIILPVLSGWVIFRYFQKPISPPRLKFLISPQAETLGDICMFLNVICFQVLFSVYVSSPHFLNLLHKITRTAAVGGVPVSQCLGMVINFKWIPILLGVGSTDALTGRLYFAAIAALLAYFPPRIFYLVIDQHRLITWLMMFVANLPLISSIVFYAPLPPPVETLHTTAYRVTAEQLHGEYEADYEAAMKKYFQQYVTVTGRVQTRFFPQSLELQDEIGLGGENGYPWVYCSFDESQAETAESLEIGQEVTFQCVGSSSWSRGPSLERCILVTGDIPP